MINQGLSREQHVISFQTASTVRYQIVNGMEEPVLVLNLVTLRLKICSRMVLSVEILFKSVKRRLIQHNHVEINAIHYLKNIIMLN